MIPSGDLENYTLSATPEMPANTKPALNDFPGDREVMHIMTKAHTARRIYVANTIRNFFIRLPIGLTAWNHRRIARKQLATLDDRLLSDIGIDDRADIDRVVGTTFRTKHAEVDMMRYDLKFLACNVKTYHRPSKVPAKPFSEATSRNANAVRNWFTALRWAA
mgnify:CR=1 FL=1